MNNLPNAQDAQLFMSGKFDNPVSRRTNEQAREAIASILLFEVSDPRLSGVTITSVDVSPDKRNAKVYYTTDKGKYDEVEKCFASANKFLRKLAGDRLNWRVVPELHFYLDPSIDMGEIISNAFAREQKRHKDD